MLLLLVALLALGERPLQLHGHLAQLAVEVGDLPAQAPHVAARRQVDEVPDGAAARLDLAAHARLRPRRQPERVQERVAAHRLLHPGGQRAFGGVERLEPQGLAGRHARRLPRSRGATRGSPRTLRRVTLPTQIQRATLPNGIELAYETFGDPADPPVVLVMGLATQMIGWPDGFCAELVARGLFVVRFDNRDVGLSTHLHDAKPADPVAAFNGDTSSASYTLAELAGDTVALLDHLGFDAVHLVGASMGGMIAQTVAIEHPDRVRTLTSIMSNTGDGKGGLPEEAAFGVLMARPATTRDEAIEKSVAGWKVIGSPGFAFDEEAVRERAGLAFDRGHDPAGTARQLVAVLASPDRTERLGGVRVPTLVIHGKADILVNPSGGQTTAAAIPGAELVLMDGMGHDIPRELWPVVAGHIAELAARA